jgi:hypothetical protein
MSQTYIHQMKSIGDQFEANAGALAYVARHWLKQSIYNEIDRIGPEDFKKALDSLEATFVIRLFAAFEGILKEHMAQHHSAIALPEDVSMYRLIDLAANRQTPPIGLPLRNRVHEVRRYRNSLVHSGAPAVPTVPFTEALSRLNTYLAKLPEPF